MAGVRRFIQASSIAVYDGWLTENLDENSPSDGPGHPYKMAKRAMERDLEARVAQGRLRCRHHPAGQCLRTLLGDVDRRNRRAHPRRWPGAAKRVRRSHQRRSCRRSCRCLHRRRRPATRRRARASSSQDRRPSRGPRCSPPTRTPVAGRSSSRIGSPRPEAPEAWAGYRASCFDAGEFVSREPHRDVASSGAASAAKRFPRKARRTLPAGARGSALLPVALGS